MLSYGEYLDNELNKYQGFNIETGSLSIAEKADLLDKLDKISFLSDCGVEEDNFDFFADNEEITENVTFEDNVKNIVENVVKENAENSENTEPFEEIDLDIFTSGIANDKQAEDFDTVWLEDKINIEESSENAENTENFADLVNLDLDNLPVEKKSEEEDEDDWLSDIFGDNEEDKEEKEDFSPIRWDYPRQAAEKKIDYSKLGESIVEELTGVKKEDEKEEYEEYSAVETVDEGLDFGNIEEDYNGEDWGEVAEEKPIMRKADNREFEEKVADAITFTAKKAFSVLAKGGKKVWEKATAVNEGLTE
ncbi:MAG: hypothetical protein LBM93_10150 [Oscillospiraceae bacterium]|nr:hypothetical protein [Oscillospiraceae bacterium]